MQLAVRTCPASLPDSKLTPDAGFTGRSLTVVRMELPKMKEKPRKREAKPAHVFITSTLKMMRYLQGRQGGVGGC